MDYNQISPNNQFNSFAVASMFCGATSLLLCCTGLLSIPVGALGILFAILSQRLDRPMHYMSKTGIVLSATGIILGLIILAYSIYLIATDPEYQQMYLDTLQYYNQIYKGYDL